MADNIVYLDVSALQYPADVNQTTVIQTYIKNIFMGVKFTPEDITYLNSLISYLQNRIQVIDNKLESNGRIITESQIKAGNNSSLLSDNPNTTFSLTMQKIMKPASDPEQLSAGDDVVSRMEVADQTKSMAYPSLKAITREVNKHNSIVDFYNKRASEAIYTQQRLMRDRSDLTSTITLINNILKSV